MIQNQNTEFDVSSQVTNDYLKQLIHLKEKQSEASTKKLAPSTKNESPKESKQFQAQTTTENLWSKNWS